MTLATFINVMRHLNFLNLKKELLINEINEMISLTVCHITNK